MDHFTPLASTIGGVLIGVASSMFLLLNGRIAGISGLVKDAILPTGGARSPALLFLLGLIGGGLVLGLFGGLETNTSLSLPLAIASGVLVGVGTRLSGGCTSGHGVCGIARLSPRSIVATLIFMATGIVTVFVAHRVAGS